MTTIQHNYDASTLSELVDAAVASQVRYYRVLLAVLGGTTCLITATATALLVKAN